MTEDLRRRTSWPWCSLWMNLYHRITWLFSCIYSKVSHLCGFCGELSIDPVVLFKTQVIHIVFGIDFMRKIYQDITIDLAYHRFLGMTSRILPWRRDLWPGRILSIHMLHERIRKQHASEMSIKEVWKRAAGRNQWRQGEAIWNVRPHGIQWWRKQLFSI